MELNTNPTTKEVTMTTPITVGKFTYTDGSLVGPAEYMNSAQYRDTMAGILAGTDVVFNFGAARVGEPGFAANVETAMLVAVQTDYAAWHGFQRTMQELGR